MLTPLTERAYQALLAADVGMAAGGADHKGDYADVRLNAPTSTNTVHNHSLRPRYRRITTALAGMKLVGKGTHLPYNIGNPDAIWR